jgi:PKD repeat protein
MQLTFRQGISRYQTDIYATPTFLQKSKNGEYVDLIVSPDPTIIIFAHRKSTYEVEESKTVFNAWGPFTRGTTKYLYWDLNLLDASLTRSFTELPQIVSGNTPINPAIDQHWFDTNLSQMKVWNGSKWIDKLRVFAATYSSSAIIQPFPLGTQAGERGAFNTGNLVLDSFNKPLRQSDGSFVTSSTELSIINAATKKVKFEAEIVSGMAAEYIPKYSFVQARPHKRIVLARSDDWKSRIIGIVEEDLYNSEVGIITTSGLIRNEQWDWKPESVGRPVFCGVTGEVTLSPPSVGVNQVAGYVYDADSIYVDIKNPTILSEFPTSASQPVGPINLPPVADFTTSVTNGIVPLVVNFKNTSLHSPTNFEWDFNNDGTIDATTRDATFTYSKAGTYNVRLVSKNGYGQNEILKKNIITVSDPVNANAKTNLGINISNVEQVNIKQQFPISVTVTNSGNKDASNITRTISISDINNIAVEIDGLPVGSKTVRIGRSTFISLPILSTLAKGETQVVNFKLKSTVSGSTTIKAGVISPDIDSSLGNNTAEQIVKVK